jgi:hypothetical protein
VAEKREFLLDASDLFVIASVLRAVVVARGGKTL